VAALDASSLRLYDTRPARWDAHWGYYGSDRELVTQITHKSLTTHYSLTHSLIQTSRTLPTESLVSTHSCTRLSVGAVRGTR
jgi:hypothetical protein